MVKKGQEKKYKDIVRIAELCLVIAAVIIVIAAIITIKCRADALEKQTQYYEMIQEWGYSGWDKGRTFICGDGCFGMEDCKTGFHLMSLLGCVFSFVGMVFWVVSVRKMKKDNKKAKLLIFFNILLLAIGVICLLL